jgi:hypothetical protein
MQSDRFAREIVCILAHSDAARSRRLMRNPLGRAKNARSHDHIFAVNWGAFRQQHSRVWGVAKARR